MSNIRLLTAPPISGQERFGLARQRMVAAFRDWLRSNPQPDHVELELDATTQVLRSLCALEGDHAG